MAVVAAEAEVKVPRFTLARWAADAVVICPVATAVLLVAGDGAWWPIVSLASVLTVMLFETFDGFGMSPGYAAEAISFALAALLAAIPPSLAMAFSERRAIDRLASIGALTPVWLVVMLAPALIVFRHAGALDPSLHAVHLSAEFMLGFSAAATAVALAYTIWVRHNPDAVRRNVILPKREFSQGGGVRKTMMVTAPAAAGG